MFERVYVISLKRTPQRLTDFSNRLGYWPFKKPEVFEAMDGHKLPTPTGVNHNSIIAMKTAILSLINDPNDAKKVQKALEQVTNVQNVWKDGGGAWGCMESHRAILRKCLMEDVSSVLVLEDDAECVSNFTTRVHEFLDALPNDWEGIMFGGQHRKKATKVNDLVDRCNDCQRTHAFALRGSLIRDVYAMWHSYFGHCDHALGPFLKHYKVYAPNPFLIGQGKNSSQITGRFEPTRFWSGNDRHMKTVLITTVPELIPLLWKEGLHTGYSRGKDNIDLGLIEIFESSKTINEKIRELRNWIQIVSYEAAAFENGVAGIWYPNLTQANLQAIKIALGSNFLELRISSIPDYLLARSKYVLVSTSDD